MTSAQATAKKLPRTAIVFLLLLLLVLLLMLSAYTFRHGAVSFAANRFLQDYDLELRELNGLNAGTSSLSIDSAVFHWTDDERPMRLDGLTVQYTTAGLMDGQLLSVSVNRASLHMPPPVKENKGGEGEGQGAAAPDSGTAGSSQQQASASDFIMMLQNLPLQELQIGSLEIHPYFDAAAVQLVRSERDVRLQLGIEDFTLNGTFNWHGEDFVSAYFLAPEDLDSFSALLSGRVELAQQQEAFFAADFTFLESPGEVDVQSSLELDLDGLQDRLAAAGVELPALPSLSGDVQATVRAHIDPGSGTVRDYGLQLEPGSRVGAEHLVSAPGLAAARLSLTLHEPLLISGRYPLTTGSQPPLAIEAGNLELSVAGLPDAGRADARITGLSILCDSISQCRAEQALQLAVASYANQDLQLQGLSFSGNISAERNGTNSLITLEPAFTLTAQQLQTTGIELAQAQLTSAEPMNIALSAESASLAGRQISLALPLIRSAEAVSQLQVELPRLSVSSEDLSVDALVIDSDFVVLNMVTELLPVNLQSAIMEGTFGFAAQTAVVDGSLHLNGQQALQLHGSHDVAAGTGSAELLIPGIHFDTLWSRLSNFISPLPVPVDLLSGSIDGSATLGWSQNTQQQWQVAGPAQLNLHELSGVYGEIGFLGVSTSASFDLEQGQVRTKDMHSLEIAAVDPGIPIENIRLDYQLDTAAGNYLIRDLYAEIFGGTISSEGGVYDTGNASNTLLLTLQRINLERVLELASYDAVTATGLISGQLPLALTGDTVTVSGGTLVALPPGGSIRYRPEGGPGLSTGNAGLDLVYQALSNYRYDLLQANVNYLPDGELVVDVKLEGVNPDMSPGGQAINLNLNIQDNIPALLESLQAARSITDALEARLQTTESQ